MSDQSFPAAAKVMTFIVTPDRAAAHSLRLGNTRHHCCREGPHGQRRSLQPLSLFRTEQARHLDHVRLKQSRSL